VVEFGGIEGREWVKPLTQGQVLSANSLRS
jgi:hypothetical protein